MQSGNCISNLLLFFRLSTMPERLLFALITTEITLSLLAAELSGTVTLIFQFIDVPRKYLHFPPLSLNSEHYQTFMQRVLWF